MDQTSKGARPVRVFGSLVAGCLLAVAVVIAVFPMKVHVDGSAAHCPLPAFALRAPSEATDKGFNTVSDACSGAGVGRLFWSLVFGVTGAAVLVGTQRYGRLEGLERQ